MVFEEDPDNLPGSRGPLKGSTTEGVLKVLWKVLPLRIVLLVVLVKVVMVLYGGSSTYLGYSSL